MKFIRLLEKFCIHIRISFHQMVSKSLLLLISCSLFFAVLPLSSCAKKSGGTDASPVISNTRVHDSNTAEDEQPATDETNEAAVGPQKDPAAANAKPDKAKKQPTKPGKSQKILETAYTQIGKMYRYGGTSPKTGFDCSGFTRWVFAQNGIKLPRSSGEQLYAGKPVSRTNLRPGDLLIYSRRIGRRRGTHVGIYVGNGKFIHSPRSGHRIQVSDAFDSYRTRRFIAARRVIEDPNAAPLPAKEQQYLAEKALERNKPKHEPPKLHENTFAESFKIYHVRRGDTISGLASRYHVPTRQILAANQLNKKDVLQLNQRLMIPLPGGSTGTIIKPGQSRPESSNVVKHTIKRGETLGALAQKYGVSSDAIARANKLRSKHAIREGQKLIIPAKKTATTKSVSVTTEVEEEILVAEPAQASPQNQSTAKKDSSKQVSDAILVEKAELEEDILVPAPAPVPPPSHSSKTSSYTVKSGDTIWDISKKFGLSESELLAANNLKKKHTLQLGQRLVIPGKHAQKKASKSAPHAQHSEKTYVVKSGDTVWKIAKEHGLSERQLLSANNLSKKHVLRPGQKLVIP